MTILVRSLSEQLVDLLRERIFTGRVAGEGAIPQASLATELGVSKIPIREALAKLEQEGLVRSEANRGFFVSTPSTEEAEEVYLLRLKLEPDAAALAASRANEIDRQLATKTFDTLYRVTDEHGEGVGAFNRAFHLALIRPSGQIIATSMLERLHVLSERYVRKHLEPLGRDDRANEEHRQLLAAWLDRDAERVAAVMRVHIELTLDDLRRQLPAWQDSGPGPAATAD
ncbi:GntR family transcriptional regulator [Sphingopyxis fribergensis]